MDSEIPFYDLSSRKGFPNRFEEDRMCSEQIESLMAERDLLASRLCAIAFEAGMGGGWCVPAWDEDTGGYWTLTRVRPVLTVSEMNLQGVK